MAAHGIGQQAGFFIDHTTDHGHVFAQLAVDQATVDVAEHFRRLEFAQLAAALEFEHQPGGHELQQHGDESRRRAMPGDVGKVEGNAPLIHAEIVGKVARQVQRRDDLVLEGKLPGNPGALWQHVHLHLATGSLVLLQQVQAGLQFPVGCLELVAVTLVFHHQARTVKRTAHRMFEHGKVFQWLDQVVGGTQAQGLDCIAHHAGTRYHDHRQLRRALTDLADQFQAAHLRHAQIADHEVGLVFFEDLKPLLAIAGLEDAEATVFKIGGEACTDHVVVIDDQQRCTGFLHVGERRRFGLVQGRLQG
ncbi:hypothetical protein D3C78_523250 [compost metagenome]